MCSTAISNLQKHTRPHLFLLECCSSMKRLMEFHAHFITSGLSTHPTILSSIVSFAALSPAGDLGYARSVLARITQPNSFMFNTVIRGYASSSDPGSAFVLYSFMIGHGIVPNSYTYPFVIKALSKGGRDWLCGGEATHCSVIKYGHVSDLHIANSLLNMYASFGLLEDAHKVFDEIPKPDVVSWNMIVDDLCQNSRFNEAWYVFSRMCKNGIRPNSVTFLSLVSSCTKSNDLGTGKMVHSQIMVMIGNSISKNLENSLLDMYCKFGDLDSAEKMFHIMEVKTVFAWTSLLDGYILKGELKRAVEDFNRMPLKDTTAWNVMLYGFLEAGDVNSAEKIFREMLERDLVSWNSMILGYAHNNKHIECLLFLKEILFSGVKLDRITLLGVFSVCGYAREAQFLGEAVHSHMEKRNIKGEEVETALMDMYSKSGSFEKATKVFETIARKSVLAWSVLIAGLAMNGLANEALNYFHLMCEAGVKPNEITFLGALCACSHAGLVEEGKELFRDMVQIHGNTPRSEHCGCMVDLLGRAGLLKEAEKFIQESAPAIADEAGALGALVGACRMHGEIRMAEKFAKRLVEIDPYNSARYVLLSNIYAAENRWGDVEKVRKRMKASGVQKTPGFSLIQLK
ncbi:unnamed protein product [Cuscuta campestris]|uniref:Pentacotripeptide-repeat region of PRORP domain-containing protein n=1 Tax=Cuscuta campestris TaxID=132261 RepID=A0A484N5W9_9ASTE|nr:unnamed protein product [Cuscuta campestris]